MKLPDDGLKLSLFVGDVIDECMVSRENRRIAARKWRQLYYTGSMGPVASKHNRCYDHVDKLSSYLFSPADVHFTVEFDDDSTPEWQNKKERASLYQNKAFSRTGSDRIFGKANELALVEGAAIVKQTWNPRAKRLEPFLIPQSFFGVLREDVEELSRKEAMCHSYYVTPSVFRRMIWNHPDREAMEIAVRGMARSRGTEELTGDSYFHEIISGGQIGVSGLTAGGRGAGAAPRGPRRAARSTPPCARSPRPGPPGSPPGCGCSPCRRGP